MTRDQLLRAILTMSFRRLWGPNRPVSPEESFMYATIFAAKRRSLDGKTL